MQPVGALLQLTRRLRAAEHEDAEDGDLVAGEPERLLDELTVFHRRLPCPDASRAHSLRQSRCNASRIVGSS